jgi:crotonobetainyl-CoA:carnitine CoA-transferase CaiB-like acyl-CoA transferase
VLDLSSLWAGPLCSHLWQRAGAEVIKVESARRPDGARNGSAEFFRLLNDGKTCLTLDLHTDRGKRELLELARSVDIVLEGSRPRALRQMGLVAESLLASRPGLTWVSITGYGRRDPEANWVAFGDDAGVAAGLSAILHQVTGDWLVCGDAVADPLTGLHAALAGWAGWRSGGGRLFDLSLAGTVRHCITATAPPANDYRDRHRAWRRHLEQRRTAVQPPRRRGEGATSTP